MRSTIDFLFRAWKRHDSMSHSFNFLKVLQVVHINTVLFQVKSASSVLPNTGAMRASTHIWNIPDVTVLCPGMLMCCEEVWTNFQAKPTKLARQLAHVTAQQPSNRWINTLHAGQSWPAYPISFFHLSKARFPPSAA